MGIVKGAWSHSPDPKVHPNTLAVSTWRWHWDWGPSTIHTFRHLPFWDCGGFSFWAALSERVVKALASCDFQGFFNGSGMGSQGRDVISTPFPIPLPLCGKPQ